MRVPTKTPFRGLVSCSVVAILIGAGPAIPQDRPSFNTFGSPGLVDMPSALTPDEGVLTTTASRLGETSRITLNFQITPRLSAAFRYSGIGDFDHPDSVDGVFYDRSFDLRYQVLRESAFLPAVTVGLQDFVGTGIYAGEYVVATKTLTPGLTVTGGLGWGRLGSEGAFATTGSRPTEILGSGGVPSYDKWFRGDVAPFGGIAYAPNDRLRFKIEYSSDAYSEETSRGDFERDSPWNFGIDYRFKRGTQLSLYHAYGNTFGAQVTFFADAKASAAPGGIESAPQPVGIRAPGQRADLGWTADDTAPRAIRSLLSETLQKDGLILQGLDVSGREAVVQVANSRFANPAQAVGRTARAMSRVLPGSIERFVIVPSAQGAAGSAIQLNRSDVEALEHESSADILARTQIVDAFGRAPAYDSDAWPRFDWNLAPALAYSTFDPEDPVRYDVRLRLSATYQFAPNLSVSGAVSQKIFGNLDESTRESNSVLPRVRTNANLYAKEGTFALDRLTFAHTGRPGQDLYSRVTVGYLERMFAGVSGELLWKPVDSRLALGAELNYVYQRDFDGGLGLQDYDVLTGHASAYYDFGRGFHGQLDVGRYLAGDYGATVSLDREFGNGWRVGAFATLTDVSAEDFGEGSFDKGIRISVPLAALTGQATRQNFSTTIRPVQRDGGARLSVPGRLYDSVRESHAPEIVDSWGKFWR